MKDSRLLLDNISTLPQNIIETILCLVPIKDAVRTSILSRNWRYNWTKIPKLVFNEQDMFDKSTDEYNLQLSPEEPTNKRKELTGTCKPFYAIHQVLLMHQGPILEFALSIDADKTCVEIDQIINYLSRQNTVKKFNHHTIYLEWYPFCYGLPLSIFSLRQLTDLYLFGCDLDHKPTFNGFGSLTSLHLAYINTSGRTLLHLLSSCPLLECLNLLLEDERISDGMNIIKFFECLPVIEHLSIYRCTLECFTGDKPWGLRELPTTLVHLKYICIIGMVLHHEYKLYFLWLLIRSSPNLEKIKLEIDFDAFSDIHLYKPKDYADIWVEHLTELELKYFTNSEFELEFVKLILVKSPVLKKVRLLSTIPFANDERLKILGILLGSPHASPVVEIIIPCSEERMD